jgi:hypothetical protein
MELQEIIRIASDAYDQDPVVQWADDIRQGVPDTPENGDTLATFIAIELRENFDKDSSTEEQLEEAHRLMDRAKRQLEDVVFALGRRLAEAENSEEAQTTDIQATEGLTAN